MQRTASIDITWPDGFFAPMQLLGRGRDVIDDVETATAAMRAVVDFVGGKTITAASADPDEDGRAGALVGQRASLRVRDALDPSDGSLTSLLLDDIAGATLISGYALTLSDGIGAFHASSGSLAGSSSARPFKLPIDVCAGWEADGEMATALSTGEPVLRLGRRAPSDDDLPPLPPTSMRRRRRLTAVPEGEQLSVTSMFRDTYIDADGVETVVHEYDLSALVDPATQTVTAMAAAPGQLPGPDCPNAAGSAARLVGMTLASVRARVRDELVGTTTCTHLNDALRAFGDLGWLLNQQR